MLRQVSAELFKQEKIQSKKQGSDIPEKTERQTREPRTLDKDWSRVNDLRRKLIPMFKTHLGRITKLEMRTGWGQAVSTRKFFWSIHPELGTVAHSGLR